MSFNVFHIFALEGRNRGVKTVYGDNLVLHVRHVICVLGALSLFITAKMY